MRVELVEIKGSKISCPDTNHCSWQVTRLDSQSNVSDNESLYASYHTPPIAGQPALEAPTDVPVVVPSPQIEQVKTCCPGCEDLDLSQVPLILVEMPMRNPFDVNQGRAACCQAVRYGQHAHRGGHTDCPGYGGVARMQPLGGSCQEYPSYCEQEQDRLG